MGVGIFHTTYTYLNTIMDGEQPLVVTSKHTVTNTITAPDNYLSLLQPSEPGTTLFETNTYYNTIALTKTLTDSDVSKVISTTDVVRQVVITELLPSKSTSVMTSYIAIDAEGNQNPANKNDHPASPLLSATDVVKTYYVTYTYYNTYLVNGSSIVRTNVSTSSDVVTEKLYIYPTKKAQLSPATPATAAASPTATALLGAELPPTDELSPNDESLRTINVYATKTMMTTFTYYTTLEQGPNGEDVSAPASSDAPDDHENELVSTVVSSRTRVVENVVTESIPMKFLPPSAIKRLKLMLYGSAQKTTLAASQYKTVVTLIGGQPLEITAARHPIKTTSTSFGDAHTASVEVPDDDGDGAVDEHDDPEPIGAHSNEADTSKNELESDDQEPSATNDLVANESGHSPNQIPHDTKPATKTNSTKILKTTASPVSNLIGNWNFNGLKVLRPMIDAVAGLINTNFGNAQVPAVGAPLIQPAPTVTRHGFDIQPTRIQQAPEVEATWVREPEQQQPSADDIPQPLPNIEPAVGQARNPIYIPVSGNVDAGNGVKSKIPLLNGGIPISPGEIITANSDVILGRPTGNRPRIPLNNKSNLAPAPLQLPHRDPNAPFNMLPPVIGDSHSLQTIQSESYIGPPPPVPHLQLPKAHMNRIRTQHKPRPNVIPIHQQQLPQQPKPQVSSILCEWRMHAGNSCSK